MADFVSVSRHLVSVTRNSCRSSVYDVLLKFEKLSLWPAENIKSCRTVTDDWRLFHALLWYWWVKRCNNFKLTSWLSPCVCKFKIFFKMVWSHFKAVIKIFTHIIFLFQWGKNLKLTFLAGIFILKKCENNFTFYLLQDQTYPP